MAVNIPSLDQKQVRILKETLGLKVRKAKKEIKAILVPKALKEKRGTKAILAPKGLREIRGMGDYLLMRYS